MKKYRIALSVILAVLIVLGAAGCKKNPATPTPTKLPTLTPTKQISPTPESSASPEVTPSPEVSAEPGTSPTPSGEEKTISFEESDVILTVTGLQDKWYNFDLAAANLGTGVVYALYFDDGATVSFDKDVQLIGFDASMQMSTVNIAANEVKSVSEINGKSLYLGTGGNAVCFVLASDPLNYTGLTADKPLSDLPGTVR